MAQQQHVPKFGNWDGENIAYTAYFETARKGRAAGGRIINPNDPEENPADFKHRNGSRDEHHREPTKRDRSPHVIRPPPSPSNAANVDVRRAQQFHQEKKHHGKEGIPSVGHMKSPRHDFGYHGEDRDVQRYRKRDVSYSRNDEGYSTSSARSHHGRARSRDSVEQRSSYSPLLSPQQPTPRTRNNHHVENHQKVASVPKFGAWDATNPQAGAGFTVIFDKVKEERQKVANKPPDALITPSPARYSHDEEVNYTKTTKPKMLCCFFP